MSKRHEDALAIQQGARKGVTMIVFSPSAIVHHAFSRTPYRWVSHLDSAAKQAARRGETVVVIAYHGVRGLVLLKARCWVSARGRERFFPRALTPAEVVEANRLFKAPRRTTVRIQVHLESKENKS